MKCVEIAEATRLARATRMRVLIGELKARRGGCFGAHEVESVRHQRRRAFRRRGDAVVKGLHPEVDARWRC